MDRKLRFVSWKEFDDLCFKLVKKLRGRKIKRITAVARGGLKVAERVARIMGIDQVHVVGLRSYHGVDTQRQLERYTDLPYKLKNTLILDDLFKTGRTFQYIEDHIENRQNCVFAALFKQGNYVRDGKYLCVEQTDDWIVWPTEVDSNGNILEE